MVLHFSMGLWYNDIGCCRVAAGQKEKAEI